MGKNEKNTNLEDLLKVIAASGADIPVAGIRVLMKKADESHEPVSHEPENHKPADKAEIPVTEDGCLQYGLGMIILERV